MPPRVFSLLLSGVRQYSKAPDLVLSEPLAARSSVPGSVAQKLQPDPEISIVLSPDQVPETVVEPNRVADDLRRESMAFVCVHPPILSISAS